MKHGKMKIIVFIALVQLVVACSKQIGPLTKEDFIVYDSEIRKEFHLLDSISILHEQIGNPKEELRKEEYDYKELNYKKYIVGTFNGTNTIKNIKIISNRVFTKRKVTIGTSKYKVLNLYGNPTHEESNIMFYSFAYQINNDKVPKDLDLLFIFNDSNSVSTIILSTDW